MHALAPYVTDQESWLVRSAIYASVRTRPRSVLLVATERAALVGMPSASCRPATNTGDVGGVESLRVVSSRRGALPGPGCSTELRPSCATWPHPFMAACHRLLTRDALVAHRLAVQPVAMTVDLQLTDAEHVLAAQPFSALVGARITAFGPGRATLELDVDERHRQQFGLVHGGVLAYLADNASAFAAGSVLGPSLVSTGFSITLVHNVRRGVLRAVASVVHSTPRQAVCAVEVVAVARDGSTTVCAVAQGGVVTTRHAHMGTRS